MGEKKPRGNGKIEKLLVGKDAKQRARTKCKEIVKEVKAKRAMRGMAAGAESTPDYKFTLIHDLVTFTVSLSALAENDDGMLMVDVVVVDEFGKKRQFSSPVHILNPPIMVPDGTTYQEADEDGNMRTLANFVENPTLALQMVLEQAVRAQL